MSQSISSRNKKAIFTNKRLISVILVVPLIVATVMVIRRNSSSSSNQPTQSQSQENTGQTLGALATTQINESFQIPIIETDAGSEAITYVIESAEKRKEILVKGTKATAVEGRVFLILNVKIVNGIDQGLDMSTRDYVRLSVNGNQDEWYAPDIHNDPVEVQAIATKFTRIGFPINESDTDLVLQLGEITGEKRYVPVSFN